MGSDAAAKAKEMALEQLPKTTVKIVDSQTVGLSYALIALRAAEAAAQDKDIDGVEETAMNIISRVSQLEAADTLFYLDRLGRIFEAKSWAEAQAKMALELLKEMVLSQFQCDELYVNEASAPTAVHNGEGLVEFGFYNSEE